MTQSLTRPTPNAVADGGRSEPTAALSAFVARTRFDDLPGDVVEMARRCLRDSLACAIGGATLEPGRIVRELYAEAGGRQDATLLPDGPRVPVLDAVAANAYLANLLDFDDTLTGHPGGIVVPTALAVGERIHASGAAVLRAIVLGYEVATRVGDAILPSRERFDEVYANATYLGLGGAAAAAALLDLDGERTAMTLGLAGANAVVPYIRKFGTAEPGSVAWSKNNYGWAAAGSVHAALLAERGFLGPRTILDGPRGFWIMAGSDRCDFDTFTRGLGSTYRITATSFKPYPCCRYLHAAIDALKEIQASTGAGPDQIDQIHVEGFYHNRVFMRAYPANAIDGQFTLPYVLAVAAHGITPGFEWLTSETRSHPGVIALAERVSFAPNDEFVGERRYGARLTVSIEGREHVAEARFPSGHPRNPLSEQQLRQKFVDVVGPVVGQAKAEALLEMLDRTETLADIRQLMDVVHR